MVEYSIRMFKSKLGSTLPEVLLSSCLLSIAILASMWMIMNLSQRQATEAFQATLTQNRLVFQNLIASDLAWAQTQLNNLSMSCLQNQTSCSGILAPQNFKLYSQNGSLFYDATDSSSGFTANGASCSGFGSDANCSVQLSLLWLPQCDINSNLDPNCLAPFLQIQGSYNYNGSLPIHLNWSNYNFQFGRAVSRNLASVARPCPNAPVGMCANTWVCMGPPNFWECHVFAP